MKIIKITKVTVMMVIFAVSCAAPEKWHDTYEDIVPGPVSNVKVENVNGGAIINYTLPAVKDLLGAKIAYSLTPDGELMERWASAEKDTIVLEGFGDTNERTVTLYTVHKSGNVSEGVPVTIKPLTPPISLMRETLKAAATFGGVQIYWDNPLRKDIGIALYAEDSITHETVLFDRFYSNAVVGKTTFRPFKPEKQNFRIEMFDRWQNHAQPLETTLSPLEEVEIMGITPNGTPIWSLVDMTPASGSTLIRYMYRCDMHYVAGTNPFENCLTIDNATMWYTYTVGSYFEPYFPGVDIGGISMPFPVYWTFDMGKKATYSRVKIRFFARSPNFSGEVLTDFVLWGTNNIKAIEDVEDPHGIYPKGSVEANRAYWTSWDFTNGTDVWKNDGWVKLATCKYFTDAGDNQYYDNMPLSANDLAKYQADGYDFEFNEDVTESFRYLRWEINKISNSLPNARVHYIQFWGSYAEDE